MTVASIRAGTLRQAPTPIVIVTPEQAGWTYSGLEVFTLGTGRTGHA